MNRFDYVWPATVAEAIAAAALPGSTYLAAGTNLLDLMKGGIVGLVQIEGRGSGAPRPGCAGAPTPCTRTARCSPR